jgi:predicted peroxiredoxin
LSERLAILIAATDTERPDLCVTPLVHALVARALDAEVEIHFAGPAVRWLVAGFAETSYPTIERAKSIGAWLDELVAAGVRLYACSMARAAWVAADEPLIAPAHDAGATAFIARSLDPAWQVLVY